MVVDDLWVKGKKRPCHKQPEGQNSWMRDRIAEKGRMTSSRSRKSQHKAEYRLDDSQGGAVCRPADAEVSDILDKHTIRRSYFMLWNSLAPSIK